MAKAYFVSHSIIIMYVIALHLSWAALLITSHDAGNATAVNALVKVCETDIATVVVLTLVSTMAAISLFLPLPWNVALLIPQQSLLIISAVGVIGAVAMSQFADGVIRPREFIAADQDHIVLAALAHAGAIITRGLIK